MAESITAGELPKDALNEISLELYRKAIGKLVENRGLGEALLERFISHPQDTYKTGQVTFINNDGAEYDLTLERDEGEERIALSTTSEGVEEEVRIWVLFEKNPNGACKLFEGVERGAVDMVVMSFRRTDWIGDSPVEYYVNSSKASEKIRTFLKSL